MTFILTLTFLPSLYLCSNLCTEIVEYTSPDEVAVCNLASISLSKFVTEEKTFDFDRLYVLYIATVLVF